MAYETLNWVHLDGVAEITLNRPEAANALNSAMAEELFNSACRCAAESVRAVLITGSGKLFSAGGDLNEFAAASNKAHHVTKMATVLHTALSRFAHLDAPVIMAINGTAGGAGFSIALSGDVVIASENAKFVSAYTASGLSPDGSCTYYLAKHVGLLRAKELVLTNRVLTAKEAHGWGMLTRVVPPDNLMSEARKLAKQIAQGPTKAFGAAKHLLDSAFCEGLETQMDREVRNIAAMMDTRDAQHGIESFLAKSSPEYFGN